MDVTIATANDDAEVHAGCREWSATRGKVPGAKHHRGQVDTLVAQSCRDRQVDIKPEEVFEIFRTAIADRSEGLSLSFHFFSFFHFFHFFIFFILSFFHFFEFFSCFFFFIFPSPEHPWTPRAPPKTSLFLF